MQSIAIGEITYQRCQLETTKKRTSLGKFLSSLNESHDVGVSV